MNMRENKMNRKLDLKAFAALILAASLGLPALAHAQSDQQTAPSSASSAQVQTGTSANGMNPNNNSTYATGQPLPTKSNEGFWGHMNPFARKKWVNRQLNPVKDRLNELDQLTAKNANDIKDVDSRAQAGIRQAQSTADQANKLNTTIAGLDQYQKVNDTIIRFRPGQSVLNARAKDALDQIATQAQGQKGYIIEVEGHSPVRGQAGIQSSQRMADAVVRYLVTEKQIPVYRIHQVAMGNAKMETDSGETISGSAVRVSTMQNSLAALNSTSSNAGSPIGATQQSSAQPSPQGAASQPAVPQQ